MNDWADGYRVDINYTHGYYEKLNPLRTQLIFLNAGLAPPRVRTACELGFGQGISVNVHAAASTTQWYGTDFNPAQANFSRNLAEASGSGAQLFDEAFDQFCNRSDLPDFDFIGLHGIWTWISDKNRAVIVEFIRRKLSVGGALYISYNTQPGHAAMKPMRDLMELHFRKVPNGASPINDRIDSTLEFTDKLLAANPKFAAINPSISEKLRGLKDKSREYLAHEYFNLDWAPMAFAEMAEWLEPAKLQWVASANHSETLAALHYTPEQQTLLASISDPVIRQAVSDFCSNTQFRSEYWTKGAYKLPTLDRREALGQQRVVMITPRDDVRLKVTGSTGEADLHGDIYNPILDVLADYKVKTLAQILAAVPPNLIAPEQLREAIMLLISNGCLQPAQEEATISKARKSSTALNARLLDAARSDASISILASPVLGGAIPVDQAEKWFLLAMTRGLKSPADWAKYAWEILKSQGRRLSKEGKMISDAEENLNELTDKANLFSAKRIGIHKALQII